MKVDGGKGTAQSIEAAESLEMKVFRQAPDESKAATGVSRRKLSLRSFGLKEKLAAQNEDSAERAEGHTGGKKQPRIRREGGGGRTKGESDDNTNTNAAGTGENGEDKAKEDKAKSNWWSIFKRQSINEGRNSQAQNGIFFGRGPMKKRTSAKPTEGEVIRRAMEAIRKETDKETNKAIQDILRAKQKDRADIDSIPTVSDIKQRLSVDEGKARPWGAKSGLEAPKAEEDAFKIIPGFDAQGRYLPHPPEYIPFQYISIEEMLHIGETSDKGKGARVESIRLESMKDDRRYSMTREGLAPPEKHSTAKSFQMPKVGSRGKSKEKKSESKVEDQIRLRALSLSTMSEAEKAYLNYMERMEDKVLIDVPMPIKIVMYQELTEVLQKTTSSYKKLVGKNHNLTRRCQEKSEIIARWTDILQNI